MRHSHRSRLVDVAYADDVASQILRVPRGMLANCLFSAHLFLRKVVLGRSSRHCVGCPTSGVCQRRLWTCQQVVRYRRELGETAAWRQPSCYRRRSAQVMLQQSANGRRRGSAACQSRYTEKCGSVGIAFFQMLPWLSRREGLLLWPHRLIQCALHLSAIVGEATLCTKATHSCVHQERRLVGFLWHDVGRAVCAAIRSSRFAEFVVLHCCCVSLAPCQTDFASDTMVAKADLVMKRIGELASLSKLRPQSDSTRSCRNIALRCWLIFAQEACLFASLPRVSNLSSQS